MAKKPVPTPRPKPPPPKPPLPREPWRHRGFKPAPPKPPVPIKPPEDIRDKKRLVRTQGAFSALEQKDEPMQKMKKGLGFSNKQPKQMREPKESGPSNAWPSQFPGGRGKKPDPHMPYTPGSSKTKTMPYTPGSSQMRPLDYSMDGIDGRFDPPGYADGGIQNIDSWNGDTQEAFENMPYDPAQDPGMENLGKQEHAQKWSYSNWLEATRGIAVDERRKYILDDVYDEADHSYRDGQDGPDPEWVQEIMQYGAQQGLNGQEIQAIIDDVRNSRREDPRNSRGVY